MSLIRTKNQKQMENKIKKYMISKCGRLPMDGGKGPERLFPLTFLKNKT